MKTMLVALALLFAAHLTCTLVFEGPLTAHAAIAQVNGGDAELAQLRVIEAIKCGIDVVMIGLLGGLLVAAVVSYGKWVCKSLGLLLLLCCCFTGCVRSYDTPEYAEIGNQETGFLISIEGTTDQAKLPSEDYLASKRIADKRVQITHRWNQTGRASDSGEWIPNVRLIKVNRTPVTRLWTKDASVGTSTKNEAVSAETKDSVNFTAGFSCTAMISEEDATRFLYTYSAGSLASVMDSEMLGRIQHQVQSVANKYTLDELRVHKNEIQDTVEKDLKSFYKPRGITITNVAMYGGLSYENAGIQKAIDDAAITQNLKVSEEGRRQAQEVTNARLILEADGTAAKAKRTAEGEAAAKLIAAKAEADSVKMVNSALEEAQHNPLLLQFRTLEIQKLQTERWDGRLPQWQMGSGNAPGVLLNVPSPVSK